MIHNKQSDKNRFDSRFMIGCHSIETAIAVTKGDMSNLRVNGDKKFYVPRCKLGFQLWNAKRKQELKSAGYKFAQQLYDSILALGLNGITDEVKGANRIWSEVKEKSTSHYFRDGAYGFLNHHGLGDNVYLRGNLQFNNEL